MISRFYSNIFFVIHLFVIFFYITNLLFCQFIYLKKFYMRLPHINNPLSPIWLILHIDSVLGQRVCSDLEPSFNVKCEVHSWSLGHKLFPIGQILLKLNPHTDPRKTYKSISIRFTRFNKTPQTYWGRGGGGGFPSKMKGCGVGWRNLTVPCNIFVTCIMIIGI